MGICYATLKLDKKVTINDRSGKQLLHLDQKQI